MITAVSLLLSKTKFAPSSQSERNSLPPVDFILAAGAIIYSDNNDLVILFIEGFGTTISEVMCFFFGIGSRFKRNEKRKKNVSKQNYFKDFSILFLLTVFYMANIFSPYYLKDDDEKKDDTSRELYINDGIELILITLATLVFLKYKYYTHHIISIILILILCIITDIILDNFHHTDIYTIVSSLLLIVADSFLYSYFKYLIDYKYYFFLDVLFIYGVFNFICYAISLIIVIYTQKLNGTDELIFQFYNYYIDQKIGYITFRFFFGLIFVGFFADILEFLMLYKLTPNYVIIGYELGRIPSNIIDIDDYKKWITLLISLFQIMSLSFYLEILEYNFCSLNKNTRKNIKDRELAQTEMLNGDDDIYSVNDIDDDYYISRESRDSAQSRDSRISRISKETEMDGQNNKNNYNIIN